MNFKELVTTTAWWGKLLGSCCGYLIAGPIGALIGLLIGNFFDKGLASHFTNPQWLYLNEKRIHVKKLFFNATFSVMGYVAKADGHVSEAELNTARKIMREMHLNREQKKQAIALFGKGKQPHFKLHSILIELRQTCYHDPALLRLFIDIQYQIAQTDGITFRKIQVLNTIFSLLGFAPFHQQHRFYEEFGASYQEKTSNDQHSSSSSSYKTYYNQPSNTHLEQAYALMEVSPESNKQEVKRAYRRLLSQHHPDKLVAQNLSQDKIKKANEKTQQIVKAYKLICTSKGW